VDDTGKRTGQKETTVLYSSDVNHQTAQVM